MTITTFDKLSPQDQSLVRLAMQYRDNAYTPYSHHQVGASVRTASGTCYGGCLSPDHLPRRAQRRDEHGHPR